MTAAGTGSPIRRAQVRVMSMEGRGGGVTNTDAEGRFEIKDLPAGRYTISAMKGGFVQGTFGQRRTGDPGTPIDLADGQIAEKVSFTLARGSVISGRIVDDGGEPVSGTQVTALRYQFMQGSRRLIPAASEGSTDRTDDQGGFRLYGLPPGEYFVSANNRNNMMIAPGMNSTEADGYAPTYYPGTPNVAEATRVTVRAGQEAQASFALIVARMARVRGRAINSSGQAVSNAMLMLTPADTTLVMAGGIGMSNAMIAPDGTFQFTNVPPGRYNLQLRPNGMPTATSEIAMMPVTVGNDDIDNLVLTAAPAAIARGVIMTDDSSSAPFRPDQVSLFAQPAEPGAMFAMPNQNRINDDYTFELTGLFDRRLIRGSAGGGGSGWYLKAVLYDGNDITDSGMEFSGGRVYEGLQVVFTRKSTDLSGALTDDRGNAVVDATVVIFPADSERWTFSSRYLRTVRPDTNGRFSIKAMPPLDNYMIIAVQNLESGQAADPEFLTRAREEARPFSLNDGETKAVDIKLSKLVP